MQPEPTNVTTRALTPETASDPATTSQHGRQRSDDDPQVSLHSFSSEVRGRPEQSLDGSARSSTRSAAHSEDGDCAETHGLNSVQMATPPPRNRIAEYENALANSARKPAEAPLFEVIKSNRKPEDRSSPIAKLPNGE